MRKILTSSFVIILVGANLFAQENNSVKPTTSSVFEQNNYSESKPYIPTEFEPPKGKSKKESKSKKSSNENNRAAIAITPQAIQNGSDNVEKTFKIPVSVFNRNGDPVLNLTKSDFKVFINDAEQEISNFEIEDEPLNLFLILDVSPSMENNIEDIKRFATELTAALKPEDKVQIIKFAENVKALTELTNDRKLIEKAIRKLDWEDGTSLYDSIPSVLERNIKLVSGRATVVFLSDGVDTTSRRQSYETSLVAAEKSNAVFFTFYLDTYQDFSKIKLPPGAILLPPPNSNFPRTRGVTKVEYEIGKQYMLDLAWLSGGKPFEIRKISELKSADFVKIPAFLKPQYTIGITLPHSTNAELGQIKVRVNRPNLTVQARGSLIVGDVK